jgi:hypothetical protein
VPTSIKAEIKMTKKCKICEEEKEDDQFRPKRCQCKDCEKSNGRKYRRENPDKSKKWVSENKDRMSELQANWYKSNKTKINEKFKERYHDTNSDFKKIKNYRTAINHMLNGHQKTNKYIGCKRDLLVEWMTYCFEDGMNMENYGTFWTVDHVIPLDLTSKNPELFDMISKWTNIMPVLSTYNLTKNKRVDKEQVNKHSEKLRHFLNHKKIRDNIYEEYLRDTL